MKKSNFKLILEGWKNYLNEGEEKNIYNQIVKAKSLLKNNEKLQIKIYQDSDGYFELKSHIVDDKNNIVDEVAFIQFEKLHVKKVTDVQGVIRDCFIIFETKHVNYNLGPLMYDILIEFASKNNALLISDRFEVSKDAKVLWNNYLYNRSDVEKAQLDIDNDDLVDKVKFQRLTPQFEDDFYQNFSILDMRVNNLDNWFDSAFSKGYYKLNTPILDTIKSESEEKSFIYIEEV